MEDLGTEGSDFVRSHKKIFLGPSETFNPLECASALAFDSIALGGKKVTLEVRDDGWYVIASSFDWIVSPGRPDARNAFRAIAPIGWDGNKARIKTDIVAATFAQEVITAGADGVYVIKGRVEGLSELASSLAEQYPAQRVVAFRGIDH